MVFKNTMEDPAVEGYDPLYSDRVNPNLFTFDGSAEDYATGLTLKRRRISWLNMRNYHMKTQLIIMIFLKGIPLKKNKGWHMDKNI